MGIIDAEANVKIPKALVNKEQLQARGYHPSSQVLHTECGEYTFPTNKKIVTGLEARNLFEANCPLLQLDNSMIWHMQNVAAEDQATFPLQYQFEVLNPPSEGEAVANEAGAGYDGDNADGLPRVNQE